MTKIGLHIIGGTTLALGHPRVVKLVDVSPLYVRQVRSQVGANCLILIRWVEQHADWLRRGPGEWFDAHLSLMRAMADENVAFESLNEVPDEHARAYAQFEAERLRLMHGVRLRSVVGNWSVGVPDLGTWHVYQPALDAMDQADMAGVHEYWVDTVDIINPWHCGRWAMVPELHNRRIVVTECGRDVVEGKGQPGWQRTCSAEEFLGDLKEYNDLLESWPNVVGATVFQAGSIDPQWAAFDATPVWPRVISEYGEEKPMLPEEPSSGIVLRCPIWHNPPVTQEFGEHAVNYAPYPGHPGQDLGVPVGTVVRAAHDGKVHYGTGYGLAFGTYVWIKGEMEGITWWTMYNHLSRILADNKEIVRAGQIIALSGNSGTSTTGPHLDWRVETEVPSAGYQDYLDKRYYWHDVREFLQ